MSRNEKMNEEVSIVSLPRLRPKRVAVSLQDEQLSLSDALFSNLCPVFLDTNILIWSFGLNELASEAWQKWLSSLRERLVIPAWVVHEYNQHTDKPEIVNPYKTLSRKLQVDLNELSDCASRALDDSAAIELGFSSKAELEQGLSNAAALSLRVAKAVSRSDRGHRTDLLKFYESLLDERGHPANIHELSLEVDREFMARSSLKLSPGGEDSDKSENRCGDLIIWKEILQHCVDAKQGRALFVSNDVKRDWCYSPVKLLLDGGKEIPWSKEAAQNLRLPNPELLLEFQMHTGGSGIVFATIEQVIETLASTAHNTIDAIQFRELARALRSSRTPTDQAVDWIHRSEDVFHAGLRGPASWDISPSEVNMDEFEAWCRHQMIGIDIPLDKVKWSLVFAALYL
ncbi:MULTISPECIES: PIN domain-containing protein [unclassified Janthinobacterium]|uniref:PIN domain-containing protein n=1 Tax=unclassified Janthinobacterium TaxID=2610881 RepID=UPI000882F79A|nr:MULTISPECIES: PIN domain-containing protein [unclassified Janthinobacterium]SDA53955.1 hypothetical protein SAMN03159349_01655 [Janthinobacterium sp. 551a]SFB45308.1 hypothetical protein SAMN03159300_1058 [Janthinobacterium sp. 344]